MNQRERNELDNHITGHYGEDAIDEIEEEIEEEIDGDDQDEDE